MYHPLSTSYGPLYVYLSFDSEKSLLFFIKTLFDHGNCPFVCTLAAWLNIRYLIDSVARQSTKVRERLWFCIFRTRGQILWQSLNVETYLSGVSTWCWKFGWKRMVEWKIELCVKTAIMLVKVVNYHDAFKNHYL